MYAIRSYYGKPDVLDPALVELHVHADAVAAQRVRVLVGDVRLVDRPVVTGVPVVLEDVLPVDVVPGALV